MTATVQSMCVLKKVRGRRDDLKGSFYTLFSIHLLGSNEAPHFIFIHLKESFICKFTVKPVQITVPPLL